MAGNVLVTGGAGYIGSHSVVELVNSGFSVTILDNLSNSRPVAVERLKKLVEHPDRVTFIEGDCADRAVVDRVMGSARFDAVIHFAALKAVGESVAKPLEYYDNNLSSLLNVLYAMRKHGVGKIVFSSSATVYGNGVPPFTESSPTGGDIPSPYGQTKYMAERIIVDCARADAGLQVALLRYFNPVGAHASGTIGEDPRGIPNNLVPVIQRVATGKMAHLTVFGTDYATPDGTAQRDYIHVVDLAVGHVKAIQWLQRRGAAAVAASAGGAGAAAPAAAGADAGSELPSNCGVFNLGTGTKHTVLEVVASFERACGKKIATSMGGRRAGDVPACWADVSKAKAELGFEATLSLDRMIEDSWRWASANPDGYDTVAAPAAASAGGAGGSA